MLDYFVDAYRSGLTPNPCVLCNRHIKFGLLLGEMEKSAPRGLFASGHYAAKAVPGRPLVSAENRPTGASRRSISWP